MVGISPKFKELLGDRWDKLETVTYKQTHELFLSIGENERVGYFASAMSDYDIATQLSECIDYSTNTCNFSSNEYIELLKNIQASSNPQLNPNSDVYGFFAGNANLDIEGAYPYAFAFITSYDKERTLPDKEEYAFEADYGGGVIWSQGPCYYYDYKPLSNSKGERIYDNSNYNAISEKSKVKDIAWEYIKFTLSDEAEARYRYLHLSAAYINKEKNQKHAEEALIHYIKRCISGIPNLRDNDAEKNRTDRRAT